MLNLRPKQQAVLDYTNGYMGVSAVPGSGKTFTLSLLAAKLVAEVPLESDQEVLIVTMTQAAAGNFAQRVNAFVRQRGLLASYGYRVRTLHALANEIVRERPDLAGVSSDISVADERTTNDILQEAALSWLRMNPWMIDDYLADDYIEDRRTREVHLPREVVNVARSFIKQAKSTDLMPWDVRRRMEAYRGKLPLAQMCYDIYVRYQDALSYRGAMDFEDLIRLALMALRRDADYLARLHERWPYILEDEAQDSSLLQEAMLRLLAGENGNWVRVGDPNQSIYESFTTANPQFLRAFLGERGVQARELPNSGRSTQSIITLANHLIDWTLKHPHPGIQAFAPLQPPYIEPAPPGDAQPNPPDQPDQIHLIAEGYPAQEELNVVAKSVKNWLNENPDCTAAVLVPRNDRGAELAATLERMNVPYVEMLHTSTSTRKAVGVLGNVLAYLSQPSNARRLGTLYRVWQRERRDDEADDKIVKQIAQLLGECPVVESFVWPQGEDWLNTIPDVRDDADLRDHLETFRGLVQSWQGAALLPVDQLVLTVAQDLFTESEDLAVAHGAAVYLRQKDREFPNWRLPEFTDELTQIARNKKRFFQLGEDDTGFDPDKHRGKVTIATVHGSKGLEWDRVYLISVNNYSFPSNDMHDTFIGERWYMRDELNLQAEVLAQLDALTDKRPYREGDATRAARVEYAAERLRLLYVGITRARRELVITWNTGRDGERREATPLIALRTFWEGQR